MQRLVNKYPPKQGFGLPRSERTYCPREHVTVMLTSTLLQIYDSKLTKNLSTSVHHPRGHQIQFIRQVGEETSVVFLLTREAHMKVILYLVVSPETEH